MENIDSPYIYEKPLAQNKSKRVIGLTAVGLAGLGSILGGTAIASSFQPNPTSQSLSAQNSLIQDPAASSQGISGSLSGPLNPGAAPLTVGSASLESQNLALPIQAVKAIPNQVLLPSISQTNWGNTSSATPSAGSASPSGSASYGDDDDDRSDRDDDEEDED
jgi:hypothetical protein